MKTDQIRENPFDPLNPCPLLFKRLTDTTTVVCSIIVRDILFFYGQRADY
jgi:hypothetical protein